MRKINESELAEQRIAELEREVAGVQEMLGFVLFAVGEPVVLDKETLKEGFPEDVEIFIDDTDSAFVFSLVEKE